MDDIGRKAVTLKGELAHRASLISISLSGQPSLCDNAVATSVGDLVTRHGVAQGDVSRCLPLAFLAPDIVEAILQGRQPVELTVLRLKRIGLPLSWADQRRLLGFES